MNLNPNMILVNLTMKGERGSESRSEEKGGVGVGEDYGYTNEKEGVDVRISSERAPTKKNGNRKHLAPPL